MEISDWDEYRTNTGIMFSTLEACIQQLVRTGNNISISRTGNLDNGKRVRVEIFNPIDVEVYLVIQENVIYYSKTRTILTITKILFCAQSILYKM